MAGIQSKMQKWKPARGCNLAIVYHQQMLSSCIRKVILRNPDIWLKWSLVSCSWLAFSPCTSSLSLSQGMCLFIDLFPLVCFSPTVGLKPVFPCVSNTHACMFDSAAFICFICRSRLLNITKKVKSMVILCFKISGTHLCSPDRIKTQQSASSLVSRSFSFQTP